MSKIISKFLVAIVLATAFLGTVCAQSLHTYKEVLDNGLTILITPMPSSSFVSVQGWIKTGSATEGKYLGSGISHYLEHMLFKGTPTRPDGVDVEVKSLGGYINAGTSYDHTYYYFRLPKEDTNQGLDILADMLFNAHLDSVEMEKEREVIINEMRLIQDRPYWQLIQTLYLNMYQDHSYRYPIIGYEDVFRSITQDDLRDYYEEKYVPNNMVISVAGGVDLKQVREMIKNKFSSFKRKAQVLRQLPQEKEAIIQKRVVKYYPTDVMRVAIGFAGVEMRNQDMYALDVLAMLLGQGRSSRLYSDLVQNKKMIDSISSSNYTPVDQGSFMISMALSQDNLKEVINEVDRIISDIKSKGVRNDELQKAQKQVLANSVFSLQLPERVAVQKAMEEIYVLDPNFSQKYIEAIKQVTSDDIKRVAQEYLDLSLATIVELRPEEQRDTDLQVEDESLKDNDIQKHTLNNGITLLIKEDPALPIVSMDLGFRAGSREESKEFKGLFQLLARLWDKGVKGKNATQIAKELEQNSVGIHVGSGFNTLYIRGSFLKEDFDLALSYFQKFIFQPTFPETELAQQKEKQKLHIQKKKDSVRTISYQYLLEELFSVHPFHYDESGTDQTIDAISHDQIIDAYQKFLSPENMVISVFGDVDASQVYQDVAKVFEKLKPIAVMPSTYQEPPLEKLIEKEIESDKEQAVVLFGAHGVDIYDEDQYALQVLSSIMGSSLSGRLFKRIRDDLGQAYTLGVRSSSSLETGYVSAIVLTSFEHVENVKQLLIKEFEDVKQNPVTDQELKDSKLQLINRFKLSLEKNAYFGFSALIDEMYGLGFSHYQNYEPKISAVTKEDIMRVAQKYFTFDKGVFITLKPKDPQIGVKQLDAE